MIKFYTEHDSVSNGFHPFRALVDFRTSLIKLQSDENLGYLRYYKTGL